MNIPAKVAVSIDAALAVAFASASAWLFYGSHVAEANATRTYGRNVDSGAVESLIATYYLAPVAVLFVAAVVFLLRNWRLKWVVHWFAVAAVVVPFALELRGPS